SISISTKGVNIPSGLNNGQQIEKNLGYYLWPVADIADFSKLPIPFVCNATDIITYRNTELKNGYLPDAIRASFTVPSVFTPIQIDTLLLLDGGLIRNFPASSAKGLGADILVGSYVGFDKYSVEKLHTLPGIIGQIAMSRSAEDFEEEKKLVSLLARPDVARFSVADFNNVDSLVMAGYVAALPLKDRFKRLADSLDMLGRQQPAPRLPDKNSIAFDRIEITGNRIYSTEQIAGILDITPGEPVDRRHLTEKIDLLYGRSWFEKVKYRVVSRNDSLILAIDCVEKPNAMLYGSVHYDNALQAGLIMGFTLKNYPVHRSVIDFNSYIGTYYRIRTDILQYFGKNQKMGFNINLFADNTLLPWLEHNAATGNTYSRNTTYRASINNYTGLSNMFSVYGSYEETALKPDYYVPANSAANYKYNYISSGLVFSRNTLDSKYFPGKGVLLNLSVGVSKLHSARQHSRYSETVMTEQPGYEPSAFYSARGSITNYFRAGNVTVALGGEAIYTGKSDSISEQNNFLLLGGVQATTKRSVAMPGFHPNQIKVRNMAAVRSEIYVALLKDLYINIMAGFAAAGNIADAPAGNIVFLSGYGLGASYNSVIGPIKAGIMYGEYGEERHFKHLKTYISIGYDF
ncbi:MAG: BamA/TamA family outer membrane protein, partial [Bacteroidales bacterium]|nr:BamA/TamA family outer membrane protein [Bacteroidales bacterium]